MNAVDTDPADEMTDHRNTSASIDYNDEVERYSSSHDLNADRDQHNEQQQSASSPNSPSFRGPIEVTDSPQYRTFDNSGPYQQQSGYGSSDFQTPGGYGGSSSLRRSGQMDDSTTFQQQPIMTDPRMNRIALAEAAMREEMFKECTFRPQIKRLPAGTYGPMKEAGTPFQARVIKWQKEKELAAKAKSKMIESGELVECTFNPKINRNSEKAIKEIRGPEYSESANDRLYRTSDLYVQQRALLISESQQKEEEKRQQLCPFQPVLLTKRSEVHKSVVPKYATHGTKTAQLVDHSNGGGNNINGGALPPPKDCTFTPQVNRIKSNMSSAKLYLSSNVVERLTRPVAAANGGVSEEKAGSELLNGNSSHGNLNQLFDSELTTHDRPVMDMASFMDHLQQKPSTAAVGGRPRSASATRGDKATVALTQQEKEERKRQFEMFLSRQNNVMERKKENIKQIDKALTPNFKPQISKRAHSRSGASFVERVDREIERRKAHDEEITAATNPDGHCTFKPQLSKRSAQLPRRSVIEMSVGDAMKKKNALQKLKLQAQQEELADATFQPKLSEQAKKAKSVLQLNSDPGQFLTWYMESKLKKDHKRVAMMREKDEIEQRECTFSPATTQCPTYVKRIAKSMAIVKAARNSAGSFVDANAGKPEWR